VQLQIGSPFSTEALEALRAGVRVAAQMVLDRMETRRDRDGAVRGICEPVPAKAAG
jgi:hypothetical protein